MPDFLRCHNAKAIAVGGAIGDTGVGVALFDLFVCAGEDGVSVAVNLKFPAGDKRAWKPSAQLTDDLGRGLEVGHKGATGNFSARNFFAGGVA